MLSSSDKVLFAKLFFKIVENTALFLHSYCATTQAVKSGKGPKGLTKNKVIPLSK